MDFLIPKQNFEDAFKRIGWSLSRGSSRGYSIFTSPHDSNIWTVLPSDENSPDYRYYQEKNIKMLLFALNIEENRLNFSDIANQLLFEPFLYMKNTEQLDSDTTCHRVGTSVYKRNPDVQDEISCPLHSESYGKHLKKNMKRTLGRNFAFKRTKHKEQDCGELCECECHKKIEWKRKLLDLVDDKESGYVDFAELIRETISQRKQEIAETLEKKKYTEDQGIDIEMKCYNDGLDDAISIIKYNQ